MRLAQVINGVVVNVIEAATRPSWAADWPEATEAGPGWSYANGVFAPVQPVVPVPESVSAFQAKAALMLAGILPQVEATIAQADAFTQLAWAEALTFRRDSPAIAALSAALGLTSAQVDDLFRTAATISA